MTQSSDDNDADLLFAPEDDAGHPSVPPGGGSAWKLLIVDDEPAVHDVTQLALANFTFEGRPLQFLHAHSASEGRMVLMDHPDVAVALIDVVMEHEHAGLELIRHVRDVQRNKLVRIILRTGQPGQAPERTVIQDYDINDYKEKTELSAQKLYSTVYASLRAYRSLLALDRNRRGLERIILSSGMLFSSASMLGFIQGVLEQLIALLDLDGDATYVKADCMAVETRHNQMTILAATGGFAPLVGRDAGAALPEPVLEKIRWALAEKHFMAYPDAYVAYFKPNPSRENVLYLPRNRPLSEGDTELIELFCQNAAIAYDNLLLREEIEGTQRDIVYMLGEAIETRSRETGQHVRRVAEYCRLLARGVGLSEREAEVLHLAAPLHDFGKIGIPDAILHKPGTLTDEEWRCMRQHAPIGEELLGKSEREILMAATLIAAQHHERWDGSGYPNGLKGEEIHLYGRIGAVADVFDALGSKRCYKEAWPVPDIVAYLREQRGRHFDPALVDWVLDNLEEMERVREDFPD